MSQPKTQIVICLGSSCFSRGNKYTLEIIKDYLTENQIEAQIDFKGQLCSQSCNKGPVIWINDKKYEAVTPANIVSLLDKVLPCYHEQQ